ncbi:MAG: hypothetical protein J0I29_06575 [Rhizobiales bacterium]|nr:hypothetical protein [Hyphomicrobiales bacterium]
MPNDNRSPDDRWRRKRVLDILSAVAVLALILTGYHLLERTAAPARTSFIVPSQSVHW